MDFTTGDEDSPDRNKDGDHGEYDESGNREQGEDHADQELKDIVADMAETEQQGMAGN